MLRKMKKKKSPIPKKIVRKMGDWKRVETWKPIGLNLKEPEQVRYLAVRKFRDDLNSEKVSPIKQVGKLRGEADSFGKETTLWQH